MAVTIDIDIGDDKALPCLYLSPYIGGVVTFILVERARPLEVFMQVVDILCRVVYDTLTSGGCHTRTVHTTGMRAYGLTKLGGHKEHSEDLTDTGETT